MLDPPCVVVSVSQMSAEWHPSSYVKGNYSYQKCYVLFTFFVNNPNRLSNHRNVATATWYSYTRDVASESDSLTCRGSHDSDCSGKIFIKNLKLNLQLSLFVSLKEG